MDSLTKEKCNIHIANPAVGRVSSGDCCPRETLEAGLAAEKPSDCCGDHTRETACATVTDVAVVAPDAVDWLLRWSAASAWRRCRGRDWQRLVVRRVRRRAAAGACLLAS